MSTYLRQIREEDLEQIMNWRMDPDITRFMNTDPKLTLEGQKKWFEAIKQDDTVRYWVIVEKDRPAGIVCLLDINWKEKNSSWGYYIGEKDLRSLKLALSLEMSLYDYVFDVLGFSELHNEVFSLNEGVIKLHQACGSRIVNEVKGEVVKNDIAYDITHISITADEWKEIKEKKKYASIDFDTDFVFHHVGYAVENMDRSIKAFNKIGFVKDSDVVPDEFRKVNIVFMKNKAGGQLVELIEPMSEESPAYQTVCKMNGSASPYHICYEVDDIEWAVKELKRRKFVVTSKANPAVAIGGRRVAFLFQKDAGLIELVERSAKSN